MNSNIKNIKENDGVLTFEINRCNVSIVNALRRTILSKINTIVFDTTKEDTVTFFENSTYLNNEILKQRLGCIPIYLTDLDIELENYQLEVDEKNDGKDEINITTEHFKILNLKTNTYLSKDHLKKIFPPNPITGNYILFAKLSPEISKQIPGEKLKFTAKLSISNAEKDGMFNVASLVTYYNTPDPIEQDLHWKKNTTYTSKETWKQNNGQRFYKKKSFNFILESLGIYSNKEIMKKACQIIINNLERVVSNEEDLNIRKSETTIANSFDITIKNDNYTIGKIIEFILHSQYYEKVKLLTFVGYIKEHPHDLDSILRLAFNKEVTEDVVYPLLKEVCKMSIEIFNKILLKFGKS